VQYGKMVIGVVSETRTYYLQNWWASSHLQTVKQTPRAASKQLQTNLKWAGRAAQEGRASAKEFSNEKKRYVYKELFNSMILCMLIVLKFKI
jgi:hypothetical protein